MTELALSLCNSYWEQYKENLRYPERKYWVPTTRTWADQELVRFPGVKYLAYQYPWIFIKLDNENDAVSLLRTLKEVERESNARLDPSAREDGYGGYTVIINRDIKPKVPNPVVMSFLDLI